MIKKARLSVSISSSLRNHLEEAREESGRTLRDEVEARLRDALRARPSEGFILLKLDDGLFCHLEAMSKGGWIGSVEDCAIYFIRSEIINFLGNENLRQVIVPHMPGQFRKHFPETARVYEAVAKGTP